VNEKELVKKILAGDQKAICEFYQHHQTRLQNYILGKISNPNDAEEILQDTFISTLNSLPNFNFRCSLFSFLCAIANHEIVDFYRRKKIKTVLFSHFPFLETIASQALTPEDKALKNALKTEIKEVFKQLRPRYSKLLRLKYLKQFSVKEIAQKLKTTPKAIESALVRARQAFRKIPGVPIEFHTRCGKGAKEKGGEKRLNSR